MLTQFPFLELNVQYEKIKGEIYQPWCNPAPRAPGAAAGYPRGEHSPQSLRVPAPSAIHHTKGC